MLAIGRASWPSPSCFSWTSLFSASAPDGGIARQGHHEHQSGNGITTVISEQYARPILPSSTTATCSRTVARPRRNLQELIDNPDVKSAYFGL